MVERAIKAVNTGLLRQNIDHAKRNSSHPVILAIDEMGTAYWKELKRGLRSEEDAASKQDEIWRVMVPFTETLMGRRFTLEPLEIVSIWSRAVELLPEEKSVYPRYSLATSIVCAYITAEASSEGWKHLFATVMEQGGFANIRKLIREDPGAAEKPSKRLSQVEKSVERLRVYLNVLGVQDELLPEIVENWGNGISPFTLIPHYLKLSRQQPGLQQ